MKMCLWTLNIGNYAPEIRELTYPFLKFYAQKHRMEFREIVERKFPDWPIVYEKLQLHELGEEFDWNMYVDADALIHPDFYNPIDHMSPDTVMHYGSDMAGHRFRYDQYFRRDGRHIGSCNWFTIASNQCLDLWRPLDDLTLAEAVKNITTTVEEQSSGVVERSHLIDDYTLSRNIARFGLKHTTITEIQAKLRDKNNFVFHQYTFKTPEKVAKIKEAIGVWRVEKFLEEK